MSNTADMLQRRAEDYTNRVQEDKMIDLIEQIIEKRSERIRSTIAEAEININSRVVHDIEHFEKRLKNLWSNMERNFHELQPYYNNPDIILEIEDLSFCVTYILKKLKKQKDNLENSKYELRVEDIRFQTHFLDDISEDIRFEKQCVDDIRKLRKEITFERLRVEDITFGKLRVEDIRFENCCVDNISKEERDVEIVDTTEEHDLVVAGNRSTANQGPWILEETKRAKEEVKAGTSSMNEGTISEEAIEVLDNDFEQAIITTAGREDFKRYFIPRETPHFGGSREDGYFVTDATMDLEPPDEKQNVEMAIKDADDRGMTVEDAVLNPKAKKKKPMACLPLKHIEQLPKEKCSEEENTKVQTKKDDASKKPEVEKDKQRDKEKEKDHNKKVVNKTIEIAEIDPVGKAYVVTTIWELLIPWQLALKQTNELQSKRRLQSAVRSHFCRPGECSKLNMFVAAKGRTITLHLKTFIYFTIIKSYY